VAGGSEQTPLLPIPLPSVASGGQEADMGPKGSGEDHGIDSTLCVCVRERERERERETDREKQRQRLTQKCVHPPSICGSHGGIPP
jgi:hypothetical protein